MDFGDFKIKVKECVMPKNVLLLAGRWSDDWQIMKY